MPKLKKLDVQGFKSFADPITFVFPTGITAIVGPNGSGKSNVADAVRWVLGEQRMTTIRGRTGEDMVFAGSKKRARSGMARAAITFDNSDGWLPVDFAEVTIERRTYRDGKTDYLLNNSRVRLMDLRDLLDRAGLGRDAYLVIGQGLVDQVLALRPQERLALFEQAAGIAPYRTRREDAVSRLEETRRNLERVYDIIGEIEPHLRRLKKQVARVEQHAALTAELNVTLRTWYGYRWGRTVSEWEQARQRVVYRAEKVQQATTEVEGITSAMVTLRQQITETRTRLAELHRESSALHTEAERRQRELAVARERRLQLQERLEESRANLVPLRSALEAETQELASLQQEFEAMQAQLAEAQAQLAEAEAARRAVEQQRQAILDRQAQAQARALESRHHLADRQSRWEQATERLTQLAQRIARLEADLASATERRRAQQTAVEHARRALDEADAALQTAEAEVARLETALAATRSAGEDARREIGRKQAELQQVSARFEALERLHNEGAGLYAGVRAVLQAAEHGELRGLPGTIATLIRVPPHLDRAIETALGGQLQDIVAERWGDAQAAIEWLKHRRAGRATFLPLDTLDPPSVLEVPAGEGVIGVASELVEYAARYKPAVVLLLGRTAIAQNLDAARELYRKLRGSFRIVTLEGEIVRSGGAVTGGEERPSPTQGGGLLARERERRELPERVAALEAEVKALQAGLREHEAQFQALQRELQAAGERRRGAVQRRQEAERTVDREVRVLDKLIQEGDWQRHLLDEARQERERLQSLCTRLEGERTEAEATLRDAEAQLEAIARELAALADDETAQVAAARHTQMALLEQEHNNRRVLLTARQREIRRLQEQIAALEQHERALVEELSLLEARLGTLQGAYDEARVAAEELSTQIPPLETHLAGLEQALEAHELREREARRVLHDAEQRRAQAEVEANRREDQLQALRREIEEALGIVIGDLPETLAAQQPLPLDAIVSPLPVVTELPEGLERQIRDLRTQIRRLEPVNQAAKEEYDELEQRHTFLREQMTDLENASAHLRQIITELDEMMDTTFRTTFKAIASEFARIFELLFNGGTAKLSLISEETDGDDLNGNDGVEIIARPPGKRTSSLGMLSGGERTLTAVALLFAVMRVSPTPFCILDEVDAMLDEANVGRFRAMLRELSRQTQFIIITHNRGTVEVSDTIYGVSMGDDGVSQVLSLSLEDLPAAEP
ncbi:MAG TPA: chromosome segregation protein SMC [Anaerolineae bacterium]|nr:chromosome segregation protein SMC [Anaerolineae bacterium]HQK13722.1 chromosome segregation protein SMC [Anaerolineae bacterium]